MSLGGANPIRAGGAHRWRGGRVENAAASARSRARSSKDDDQNADERSHAWVSAWSAALDELELDVEQAEQLLATSAQPGEQLANLDTSTSTTSPAMMPVPRRAPARPTPRLQHPSPNPATASRRLAHAYNPLAAKHFADMSIGVDPQAGPGRDSVHTRAAHARAQAIEAATTVAAAVPLASEHAVGSSGVDPQQWAHSWQQELSDQELFDQELFEADQGSDLQADQPWSAPDLPGQLPPELAQRAATLLNRQLAVAQTLARAMLGNRQQSGLLERMDHSPKETRSAYFDRSA